jgi:hypothetical protein
MPSLGMLHCVALVRPDILKECMASIIRVTKIGEQGTLAVTSNQSMLQRNPMLVTANIVPSSLILVTLIMEVIHSSETSVLTRATWHNMMAFFIVTTVKTSNVAYAR